jgi:L-ascorbate metabolism protein UlaG (beta-lactamase superfamily)
MQFEACGARKATKKLPSTLSHQRGDVDFVVGEVKGGERSVTKQDFDELVEIAEALRAQRAIMFLPHENVTADTIRWLQEAKARQSPIEVQAQIYALPTF